METVEGRQGEPSDDRWEQYRVGCRRVVSHVSTHCRDWACVAAGAHASSLTEGRVLQGRHTSLQVPKHTERGRRGQSEAEPGPG